MKHRIEETYAIHVAYTKCAVSNVWGILFLLKTFQADPVPAFIMLPHGIYPRILPNEQPTKRLSCLAYKIKPVWATSGGCFYCWGLLTPSNDNPQKARVVLPTKIKPLWARSGACFYCWGLLG